ncbi:hypothetical protein ACXZ9C_11050 [Streptococcus agalactiae]
MSSVAWRMASRGVQRRIVASWRSSLVALVVVVVASVQWSSLASGGGD